MNNKEILSVFFFFFFSFAKSVDFFSISYGGWKLFVACKSMAFILYFGVCEYLCIFKSLTNFKDDSKTILTPVVVNFVVPQEQCLKLLKYPLLYLYKDIILFHVRLQLQCTASTSSNTCCLCGWWCPQHDHFYSDNLWQTALNDSHERVEHIEIGASPVLYIICSSGAFFPSMSRQSARQLTATFCERTNVGMARIQQA